MDTNGLFKNKNKIANQINKADNIISQDIQKNALGDDTLSNNINDPALANVKGRRLSDLGREKKQLNNTLINSGKKLLGNISVKDLSNLEIDEDKLDIMMEQAVISNKENLRNISAPQKHFVKSDAELTVVGTKVIKRGAFTQRALEAGLAFMNKVDRWAGKSENPSQKEQDYYNALGSSETLDYLYVDGKPLREFVGKKYEYNGDDKAILSTYVAMISRRQNHAITLVRPTFINGHADVDIRDLSVDMTDFGKSYSAKNKNARRVFMGRDYRRFCETAFKSDVRARSAEAARNVTNNEIKSMKTLANLKRTLETAGKGKHQDYRDFVIIFNKYYNNLVKLTSNPDHMQINEKGLRNLYLSNQQVILAAADYLSGKKMNLPRHQAIKAIKDYISAQSESLKDALREDVKGGRSVSLDFLLDSIENFEVDNKTENHIIRTHDSDIDENEINISLSEDEATEQSLSEAEKDMSYQTNILGDKISKEEFEEHGGACLQRFATEDEAREVAEKTHGFLAVKKLKNKKGIVKLVPSLPEYTSLYRGDKSEARIPLRKTVKTMFKTFVHILTDEKGHIKNSLPDYEKQSIGECIDKLLEADRTRPEKVSFAKGFLEKVVEPAMQKMLEKEYKEKALKGYKAKAKNDAKTFCTDYLTLINGISNGFLAGMHSVSFEYFINASTIMSKITVQNITNHKFFNDITIDGKTPTAQEVQEVLDEFKTEMQKSEAEFANFRTMDTDDVEVPSFSACSDNANLVKNILNYLVSNEENNDSLQYSYGGEIKNNPDKMLDKMLANLDYILAYTSTTQKEFENNKKQILEFDDKRKNGHLTQKDITKLYGLYTASTKYEWHMAGKIGTVGNTVYTTETYAPHPNELIKSPITNKVHIGKYISDEKVKADKNIFTYHSKSMTSYYDHDDPFSHVSNKKEVLKTKIKEIIYELSGIG